MSPSSRRAQLEAIFHRDNPEGENRLSGAEHMYLDRLERELRPSESVSTLITYKHPDRDWRGKGRYRFSLLVITTERIIQLTAKARPLGNMMSADSQAGSAEELELGDMPLNEIAAVDGRRTLMTFGMERELYLIRNDSTALCVAGLSRARSELAQSRIEEMLSRRR